MLELKVHLSTTLKHHIYSRVYQQGSNLCGSVSPTVKPTRIHEFADCTILHAQIFL